LRRAVRNHQSQAAAGFTLLELIIVMVLASLLLGLGAVFIGNTLPNARLASVGRDISASIRQTRLLAQNRGTDLVLFFDLDHRVYGIDGIGVRKLPPDIALKVVDPYVGEIYNGKYGMYFSATGSVEGGMVVLSYRRKAIFIETDPVVGFVRVRR
jgi:general secretion pathway protein H